LVDEIEVSENREALIVLAGTVAVAATTFVLLCPPYLRNYPPIFGVIHVPAAHNNRVGIFKTFIF
jgi:hypothetical protein